MPEAAGVASAPETAVKPARAHGGTRLPMRVTSSPLPGSNGGAGVSAGGKPRRYRLFLQLGACFLAITMVPLITVRYFSYRFARAAILEDAQETLQALVQRQGSEVMVYFNSMQDVTELLRTSPIVRDTLAKLGNVTAADAAQLAASPAAQEVETAWGERYQHFVTLMELSELYVVNPQGIVVYAAGPERQPLLDLQSPSVSALSVASVFRQVLADKTVVASGMTVATTNQREAFYYAAPVTATDASTQVAGVFIIGLNMATVQSVLDNHIGLGATGESLVVTHRQGKLILINNPHDPQLTPMQPVVPLDTPLFGEGRTTPGQALVAQSHDYEGDEVLAAWTFLPALKWTLIQKMDLSSVFEPLEEFAAFSRYVAGCTLVLVLGVAAWVARSITRPVEALTEVASRIAQGDLTAEVRVRAQNEIGQLAQAVGTMAHSLKSLVGKVQESAAVISTNAAQMSASSRQQAEVAQNTGTAAVEVSAAAKQISATSLELTRTMEEVNGVAQGTAQRAEAGLDGLQAIQSTMGELEQARGAISDQLQVIATKVDAICGITVTMTKVADQTNLLSLNAAIEARKAGEFGRGFSVVAREIQRLADQTGVATLEIERAVNEMSDSVEAGVKGMNGYAAKTAAGIERVQAVAQQLTDVIQQVQGLPARFEMVLQGMQSQAEGACQINEAIAQMSGSAQQTAAAVQEALRLLEQLRETTRALQGEVSLFKV